MALQDRDTLRNYFRQGSVPSEVHFHDLIDSLVNKVDDGLDKDFIRALKKRSALLNYLHSRGSNPPLAGLRR